MDDKTIKIAIEGILFSMGDSVSPDRIAEAVGAEKEDVIRCAEELSREWKEEGRGIRIIRVNDSYQMCSSPETYEYLVRLAKQPRKYQLTEALMETLSIIAYKQPVTRAEIEKIRGVSCGHSVSRLIDYGLVQELGRLDAPGRPLLFGTTDSFLRAFGLSSVEELPVVNPVRIEELKAEAVEEAEADSGIPDEDGEGD